LELKTNTDIEWNHSGSFKLLGIQWLIRNSELLILIPLIFGLNFNAALSSSTAIINKLVCDLIDRYEDEEIPGHTFRF
jgi:hypothetical protein